MPGDRFDNRTDIGQHPTLIRRIEHLIDVLYQLAIFFLALSERFFSLFMFDDLLLQQFVCLFQTGGASNHQSLQLIAISSQFTLPLPQFSLNPLPLLDLLLKSCIGL